MQRRLLGIALALGLVASVFSAMPVRAQDAASEVPTDPHIVDPQGDANYHSWATGAPGPVTFTGADMWAVWFSNDAENLYVNIQTTTDARLDSLTFIVYVDPGVGDDCMQLRLTTGGEFNDPFTSVNLSGDCGSGTEQIGELREGPGPEDSSVMTGVFPRSFNEAFGDGKTLATPNALVGHNLQQVSPRAWIIDDTEVGRDFTFSSGDEEVSEESGKDSSDKAKKNKKKGKKGKKAKKSKKPKVESCAPYEPGEMGAEVEEETTIVTDEATEEAPIEMEFDFGPAGGSLGPYDTTVHIPHNIQVDSEAGETGLWVRLETPDTDDPDLYVYWPNGSEAARAAGFNQAPVLFFDGTGNGGHSEVGAEQIDGIRTADCTGYTLDLVNWLGQGGTYTLKLWLGDIENDPKPPE